MIATAAVAQRSCTPTGRPLGRGWKLREVPHLRFDHEHGSPAPRHAALEASRPDQFTLARVDADELDFWTLKAPDRAN